MENKKTKESQYQILLDIEKKKGLTKLGLTTNQLWHDDPRHLLFILARYKFIAKMLSGKQNILEIGCGDAFGTRLVLQEVGNILAIDFDPIFVKDVKDRMEERWSFECIAHDILSAPMKKKFDACFAVDVIEHIPQEKELLFLDNISKSLIDKGVLIIGTPSIQSQSYASELSKKGHVNCKDHRELKELMLKYYDNVFVFSMNDEVVHTGFYPMAQYLFALGVGKKSI